jgi:hypothetical protein
VSSRRALSIKTFAVSEPNFRRAEIHVADETDSRASSNNDCPVPQNRTWKPLPARAGCGASVFRGSPPRNCEFEERFSNDIRILIRIFGRHGNRRASSHHGFSFESCFQKEEAMLWTIAVLLILLWALGMVSAYTVGGFIHILLLLAVISIAIQLIGGRRVV